MPNEKKCSQCSRLVIELHQREPALCHACWNKQHKAKNVKECLGCHKIKSCTAKNLCGACYKKLRQSQGYVRPPSMGDCLNCKLYKDIVARGLCAPCFRTEHHKEWYIENRQHKLSKIQEYRTNNVGLCTTCNDIKNLMGREICEPCYSKQYYWDNKEFISLKNDNWYHNQGGKERKKEQYIANPDIKWETNISMKYNLTKLEYDNLVKSQDGKCAICSQPEPTGKRLSIDHDHRTDELRQLLCGKCNRGLGFFNDSPELLIKAASYLELHKSKNIDTLELEVPFYVD